MASKKPADVVKDKKCLALEPSSDKNAVSERANKLFSLTLAELRDASSSRKYAAEANANRKLLRQALNLVCTIFITFLTGPETFWGGGSVPMTNGSGSGSCSFRLPPFKSLFLILFEGTCIIRER